MFRSRPSLASFDQSRRWRVVAVIGPARIGSAPCRRCATRHPPLWAHTARGSPRPSTEAAPCGRAYSSPLRPASARSYCCGPRTLQSLHGSITPSHATPALRSRGTSSCGCGKGGGRAQGWGGMGPDFSLPDRCLVRSAISRVAQSSLAMCPGQRLSHGEEEHRRAHPGRDGADTDVTSKPGRRSRHFQRSGRRRRSRRARTRAVGATPTQPVAGRSRANGALQSRAAPHRQAVRWTAHVPVTCRRADPDRIHSCLRRPSWPLEPNRSRPTGGDVGLCTA